MLRLAIVDDHPVARHGIIAILSAFDDLQVASDERGQTTIAGPVVDQAALHGLLTKVRDLGLELLEVRRSDPD